MKLLRQIKVYQYNSREERDQHIAKMESDGWKVNELWEYPDQDEFYCEYLKYGRGI